jgi:MFS family permease
MLWIGQLLSDTGSEMGLIAYPLLILALTHSPVLAGVVGTARQITLICLQLPAGALSDRFDRRLTMIACDTLSSSTYPPRGPSAPSPPPRPSQPC